MTTRAAVTAIVLAGYFAGHVLRCADRLRDACPHPVGGSGAVLAPARAVHDVRAVGVAHIVMATAMAVMLVGMI